MKIEVMQKHIDRGDPCVGESCAIALAIRDLLPEAASISIGDEDVAICMARYPETWSVHILPMAARRFIEGFDRDKESVGPFAFDFPIDHLVTEAAK